MISARDRTRLYDVGLLDYEPVRVEMFVEPEGAYVGPLRKLRVGAMAKEPFTRAFVDAIPAGGVLYDIGANVGSYTLQAAARGLQVVAFEPILQNAEMLLANLELNGWTNRVIVMQQGLSTSSGIAWVHYGDTRPGSASFAWGDVKPSQKPGLGFHSVLVPVSPLDELVTRYHLPLPTHLKIDVDGNEGGVLGGMPQVLALPSLVGILIELATPEVEQAITAQLAPSGWSMAEKWEIRNIAYGKYERVAVEPVKKPRARKQKAAA